MTGEEISQAGEIAYKIERQKGNILDVNSVVVYKLGWDAAIKFLDENKSVNERELLIRFRKWWWGNRESVYDITNDDLYRYLLKM